MRVLFVVIAYLKTSKRVAKGDETTVMIGGQIFMKAKFTIDPAKMPKKSITI